MKRITLLALTLLLSTTQASKGDSASLKALMQKHGKALLTHIYTGELTEKDQKELAKIKTNSINGLNGAQQKLTIAPAKNEPPSNNIVHLEDSAYLTSGKAVLIYKVKPQDSYEFGQYEYIVLSEETINKLLGGEPENDATIFEATKK